jgi:hypothetical protein
VPIGSNILQERPFSQVSRHGRMPTRCCNWCAAGRYLAQSVAPGRLDGPRNSARAVALSAVRGWPLGRASGMLTGLFAVLLIVAGARRRNGRILFVAAAIFVGAIVARIVVLTYAARVRSGHSVVGHVIPHETPHSVTTPLEDL